MKAHFSSEDRTTDRPLRQQHHEPTFITCWLPRLELATCWGATHITEPVGSLVESHADYTVCASCAGLSRFPDVYLMHTGLEMQLMRST